EWGNGAPRATALGGPAGRSPPVKSDASASERPAGAEWGNGAPRATALGGPAGRSPPVKNAKTTRRSQYAGAQRHGRVPARRPSVHGDVRDLAAVRDEHRRGEVRRDLPDRELHGRDGRPHRDSYRFASAS